MRTVYEATFTVAQRNQILQKSQKARSCPPSVCFCRKSSQTLSLPCASRTCCLSNGEPSNVIATINSARSFTRSDPALKEFILDLEKKHNKHFVERDVGDRYLLIKKEVNIEEWLRGKVQQAVSSYVDRFQHALFPSSTSGMIRTRTKPRLLTTKRSTTWAASNPPCPLEQRLRVSSSLHLFALSLLSVCLPCASDLFWCCVFEVVVFAFLLVCSVPLAVH